MADLHNSPRSIVGPYDLHCAAHANHERYLMTVILAQGASRKRYGHAGSQLLDATLAYDTAEVATANLGQVNMIAVSSFCGPQGLIWGFDAARVALPAIELGRREHRDLDGAVLRDGAGLRDAAAALLGTVDAPRYPFRPGEHLACAAKWRIIEGPALMYSAIGIGIPADRHGAAALFMEDVGEIETRSSGAEEMGKLRRERMVAMARSVAEVGRNQRVLYREILTDFTASRVGPGEIGCALVAAPYFRIAARAYLEDLTDISLQQWQARVGAGRATAPLRSASCA